MRKMMPMRDWNWDREVQSQILRQLDGISCQLANVFRKKGSEKVKPQKQMQPDYVEKAKRDLRKIERQESELTKEELEKIDNYWKGRNPKVRFLGEENEQS